MKRLTINHPDGTIQATGTLDEIAFRLASYEDTGLEPEEVAYFLGTTMSVQDAKAQYAEHKKRYDKYMTWEKAESEDRLLILPCKVGDSAWFIAAKQVVMHGRCRNISIHSGGIQIAMYDTDGEPWNVSYKRVFPTRAEAEAALRGGADG